ncbi:MAG: DMT family transporter [Candidatus Woesearchaeota archaeon]
MLFVCIAAFLWALEGIALIPPLYSLPVSLVVLLIHGIGFFLLSLSLSKEFAAAKTFSKKDWTILLLIALLAGALGTLAIVKALFLVNFQKLSVVLLLQKLQPVFAIVLALVLLKEKIGKAFYVWAGIAIIASYVMSFGFSLPDFSAASTAAIFYSLFASLAFASGTVLGRAIAQKYKPTTLTFYRYGLTTIIMLAIVFGTKAHHHLTIISPKQWIFLALIPLTTGLGSMLLYYRGLNLVKASVSTIAELMFPVSAIVLDYLINKTLLSPLQLLSAAVLVFSIIMINKTSKQESSSQQTKTKEQQKKRKAKKATKIKENKDTIGPASKDNKHNK